MEFVLPAIVLVVAAMIVLGVMNDPPGGTFCG